MPVERLLLQVLGSAGLLEVNVSNIVVKNNMLPPPKLLSHSTEMLSDSLVRNGTNSEQSILERNRKPYMEQNKSLNQRNYPYSHGFL